MSPTGSIPVRKAVLGEGIGSIFLDNLMCEGHESSLLDCVASEDIGTHNCEHNEDAGVRCEGTHKLSIMMANANSDLFFFQQYVNQELHALHWVETLKTQCI